MSPKARRTWGNSVWNLREMAKFGVTMLLVGLNSTLQTCR